MLVNSLVVILALDYSSRKARVAEVKRTANLVYQSLLLTEKSKDQLLVQGIVDPAFFQDPEHFQG